MPQWGRVPSIGAVRASARRILREWLDALERNDIRVAQSAALVRQLPLFIVGNGIASVIGTVALATQSSRLRLAPVQFGIWILVIPLIPLWWRLRQESGMPIVPRRRILAAVFYIGLLGVAWAVLMMAYLDESTFPISAFLISSCALLSVCATASFSVIPLACIAYAVPILTAGLMLASRGHGPARDALVLLLVFLSLGVMWFLVTNWQNFQTIVDLSAERRRLSEKLAVDVENGRLLLRIKEETESALRVSEARLAEKSSILQMTLDRMDQGIMMINSESIVELCNQRAMDLLELPSELMTRKPTFAEVLAYQWGTEEFTFANAEIQGFIRSGGLLDKAHTYDRKRPNGRTIEVRSVPLSGGGVVRTYTDITERKAAEDQVRHAANHDSLTQLNNRMVFKESLEHAICLARRTGHGFAVLYLDLDRFKAVNDEQGHGFGDKILVEVSQRMRAAARDIDVVARMGGDEFAILQSLVDGPAATKVLATRIIEVVARPYDIDTKPVDIGVSIGIARYPVNGGSADELLHNADSALYRAKAAGGNSVCWAGSSDAAQAY